MKSRYLKALEKEIATAPTDVLADKARARMASYLVRQGSVAEANALLVSLRAKYREHPSVEISCWLHLAEGIACSYSVASGSPRDRLQRALVLARACGDRSMQALAAAWLARLAFESYDITEMVKCLNEAFTNASAMDNEALGRAKLMGAVALHLAGRHDLAKSWYADTHAHATADGDDLAISALMHNIACMGSNLEGSSPCPSRRACPSSTNLRGVHSGGRVSRFGTSARIHEC